MSSESEVNAFCRRFGYGAVMQEASWAWAESDPKGSFVVGTCRAFTVPCPCLKPGKRRQVFLTGGHCDWCCGAGWVTKRVEQAMKEVRSE